MILRVNVPSSNVIRKLNVVAQDHISFSNNVTRMNVVSTLHNNHIDRSQLTQFSAGSNIEALESSCFISCYNLANVQLNDKLSSIGDYAFYSCTSLSNINIFNKRLNTISYVGDYAFAKSNLSYISVSLYKNENELQYAGSYMFSDNLSLKNAVFSTFPILANHMFNACSSLTSVLFAPNTKVLGNNAFMNCISLNTLAIPSDVEYINDSFAENCTSLASISFYEPGSIRYDYALGNRILANTQLTSITFPSSISSFNVFSNNTLAGLDKLQEIYFNGMSYNYIMSSVASNNTIQKSTAQSYATNIIYGEQGCKTYLTSNIKSPKNNILTNWTQTEFNELMVEKPIVELVYMMQNCKVLGIPMLVIVTDFTESSYCANYAANLMRDQAFKNFIKKNTKYIVVYITEKVYTNSIFYKKQSFYKYINDQFSISGTRFVINTLYWNDIANNKEQAKQFIGVGPNTQLANNQANELISQCNDFAMSYQKYISLPLYNSTAYINYAQNVTYNNRLLMTNCFGLNHDVKIFSNDGKSISFKKTYDSNAIQYYSNTQVDHITDDDFKYGQWYSHAQNLYDFANKYYQPVLVIAAYNTSQDESIAFNNIFNDKTFQTFITSKQMLLCKVDSASFASGDDAFVMNEWMNGSPTKNIPLLMVYWLKKDGQVIISDDDNSNEYINKTFVSYAYFSKDTSSKNIGQAVCVHNINEVMEWISNISWLNEYVPDEQFFKPYIEDFTSEYPKYKRYNNQENDNYGRYFPVERLNSAQQQSYLVSLYDNSRNQIEYELNLDEPDMQPLPPQGTYQYFSLLSTAQTSSIYNNIYEMSGLIFKIGKPSFEKMMYQNAYSYQICSLNDFIDSISCSSENIEWQTSSFFNDLYVYDGNVPTTQINDDIAADMNFLWNVREDIYLKTDIEVDSMNIDHIKLWLSSDAQVLVDGELSTLAPMGTQYVISCQLFDTIEENNQILWMYEFNNNMNGQFNLTADDSPYPIVDNNIWWARNDDIYYSEEMMRDDTAAYRTKNVMPKLVREKRAPFGNPIKLGEWNGYLEQCSAVAMQYEIPMIAIWSNYGCAKCHILENALLSAENVNSFLNSSGLILCFTTNLDMKGKPYIKDYWNTYGKDNSNGTTISSYAYYNFCKQPDGITTYPFVRFMWYKNQGQTKIVDYSTYGDKIDGQQGIYGGKYEKTGQNIIDYIRTKTGFASYIDADHTNLNDQEQPQYKKDQYAGKWWGLTGTYDNIAGSFNENQKVLINFMIDYAESNHIPLVILKTAFGCIKCAKFKETTFVDPEFEAWVASSPYIFLYGYSGTGWFSGNPLKRLDSIHTDTPGVSYGIPSIGGEWVKEDGTVVHIPVFSVYSGTPMKASEIANRVDAAFAEYKDNLQ